MYDTMAGKGLRVDLRPPREVVENGEGVLLLPSTLSVLRTAALSSPCVHENSNAHVKVYIKYTTKVVGNTRSAYAEAVRDPHSEAFPTLTNDQTASASQ